MAEFGMTEDGKPLHPGRILLVQAMEPLGISRNQLARDIDVPVGRISDITNGKRGITADTALRLGRYFGTGPELWLRLQAEYELHVARITTWPAVESRVRTLEVQKNEPSPPPPPQSPRESGIDASDMENDELASESYSLPGDVETDTETDTWSPTALPENGVDNGEAPAEKPASDEEAYGEDLPGSQHLKPTTVAPEGATEGIAVDAGVEEDIGIPPAPSGSTTPV